MRLEFDDYLVPRSVDRAIQQRSCVDKPEPENALHPVLVIDLCQSFAQRLDCTWLEQIGQGRAGFRIALDPEDLRHILRAVRDQPIAIDCDQSTDGLDSGDQMDRLAVAFGRCGLAGLEVHCTVSVTDGPAAVWATRTK